MVSAESLDSLSVATERPKTFLDPIVVRAFETRTGRVAAVIQHVGNPQWGFGLNAQGGWRVNVQLGQGSTDTERRAYKEFLDGVADPWRFSWAVCQGSKIWQAGPVTNEEYSEGTTTTVVGSGLWRYLTDKRVLVNPARATLRGIAGADADVAFGISATSEIGSVIPADRQNLALHTIAKRIMQVITAATGGNLPVIYPDDVAGTAVRTYPGYELASVGQRLFELSQVVSGPEIEFRPEFVDPVAKDYIRWVMRIGNPRLGNLGYPHAFDYGQALVKINRSTDGTERTGRDWDVGNGMERDLVFGFYDQPLGADSAALLLENVGRNHAGSGNMTELDGYAQGQVVTNVSSKTTHVATIRIAGDNNVNEQTRSPILTVVEVGDNCLAQLKDHPRITDGLYYFRIMSLASGTKASEAVAQLMLLGRAS